MQIRNLKVERSDEPRWTLSAMVDQQQIYFSYEGVDCPEVISGDAFVMAALVPAMKRGENLSIDDSVPVSRDLLDNLGLYQQIFGQWYPGLTRIQIIAENELQCSHPGNGSGCFFSGGVDSLYTVSKTAEELDHLVVCLGLDISIKEKQRWEKNLTFCRQFSRSCGLNLISITTNVKEHLDTKEIDNHGAILVSTGIGIGLEKLFVPASHGYSDLFPCGSHPVSDPLLSNGRTRVIHHGNVFRTDKTRDIIDWPHGLDDLRVCNVHSDYNCGKCEKCLRTMTALKLCNRKVDSLPDLPNFDCLEDIRLEKQNQYVFWTENYQLAKDVGNVEAQKAIGRLLARFRKREVLKEVDEIFLHGALIRLKRALL